MIHSELRIRYWPKLVRFFFFFFIESLRKEKRKPLLRNFLHHTPSCGHDFGGIFIDVEESRPLWVMLSLSMWSGRYTKGS